MNRHIQPQTRRRSRSSSRGRRSRTPPPITMQPGPRVALPMTGVPMTGMPMTMHNIPVNVVMEPTEQPLSPDTIELESIKDSKITSVSVYSARAEVTRQFNVGVKAGINQLLVRGLPQVMDQDSLRVEGRGAATIHDVALSYMHHPRAQASSEALEELQISKKRIENAIDRAKRVIKVNDAYLGLFSANSHHVDTKRLTDTFETYESASVKFDDRIIELQTQKRDIERQIQVETWKLRAETRSYNEKLCMKASISVFADIEGEIQIVLNYAVRNASWKAGYDIRVDMQVKGKPIQVVYKGAITQSTGEDWKDVQLILETANPTFGLTVPSLDKWTLSVKRPVAQLSRRTPNYAPQSQMPTVVMMPAPMQPMMPGMPMSMSEPMQHRGADVSSKGAVSATFSVPGLITVPSDGWSHNVTITEILLESAMSWLCIPKKDNKTHLKAKIKNASEYTLLAGSANVYVDGSFISKINVPLVSPDETFDCPLGLDPSVRVTYHALSKKESKSGFYTKSTNYVYQQRITIFNTKTHAIDGFKVLDQFPVSEDSSITVKHINPALTVPSSEPASASTGSVNKSTSSSPPKMKGIAPVKIAQGILAQWDGADEVDSGELPIEAVGKEGKVAWICSISAGSKVGLVLHWELTMPVGTEVVGL